MPVSFSLLVVVFAASVPLAFAQPAPDTGARDIPARSIPKPQDASPELRRAIQGTWTPAALDALRHGPRTADEWRELRARIAAGDAATLAAMHAAFPVTIETRTMGGVTVRVVTPKDLPAANRRRVLVHLHGGAYVLGSGDGGAIEAIPMAHYARTPVISVDYRLAPEHPFPAALDDAVAVWKEVLRTHAARNVGLFGGSAGGGLVLATTMKLRELGLPLPGALAAGTPWSDLAGTGDSYATNELVDDVLVTRSGLLAAAAAAYAGTRDPKSPLISPVYGDYRGFPPTILVTGTRDLLLSDTVRVHRRLRRAGVGADLQVFEGMSHAEYIFLFDAPESREAYGEIVRFFAAHLAR